MLPLDTRGPLQRFHSSCRKPWRVVRLTAVLLAAASLTGYARAEPSTVALLKPQPDGSGAVHVIPLLSWNDGMWIAAESVAAGSSDRGGTDGGDEPPDRGSLLQSLLNTTFSNQERGDIEVKLERKTTADVMVEPHYPALAGHATNLLSDGYRSFNYIVTNVSPNAVVVERNRPLPERVQMACEMLPGRLAERIRGDTQLSFESSGFEFDPDLYAAPTVTDCAYVSVPGGKTFAWTTIHVGYPIQKSQPTLLDDSVWSGVYVAVASVPSREISWESLTVVGEDGSNRALLTATDLNRDGIPEFVIRSRGYESVKYVVYTIRDGKFVSLAEVVGGV